MSVGQSNQRPQLFHAFGAAPIGTTIAVNSFVVGTPPANPAANQRIGVYRAVITMAGTGTVQIQDTANNPLGAIMNLALGATVFLHPVNGDPWWQAGPGLGIQLLVATAAATFDLYWLPVL